MYRAFLFLSLLGAAAAAPPALMPLPAVLTPAQGSLPIGPTFRVALSGVAGARLAGAIDRFRSRISRQTGIPMPAPTEAHAARAALRVECAAAGPDYPTLREDESYTLDITPDGALLKAPAVAGVLHGLETFLQLVAPGAAGFEVPAMHIEDRPRFPWRGLMLDSSRHWMPLEVVERNLDAMAAVKLNVFHWHLSDDQGFRAASRRYPRLQELGSGGHYYTQDQLRHIVAYARDRGIRVVPEFDMPGHTTSWLAAYPELAAAPGPYEIGRDFGIFDATLDPANEATYTFLDGFIGEMAAIFPDPCFHIGGDEVNGRQWKASESIQAFAKAQNLDGAKGLQLYFNRRVERILAKYGKTPVGWDEILDPGLPAGAVIQSWRGAASLAEAASKGFGAILSSGYYLDYLKPASYHYGIDPLAGAAAQLPPEQQALILGGEACMWGELAGPETVDSRIWPRMAAIAERLWSPREVAGVDSMYARMEAVSRILEFTGVRHRANPGPMLERLAGGAPLGPVRVLAEAAEALGLGPRIARNYTTATPLNRFADAVPPESESVRALELAAKRVAADPSAKADAAFLRARFAAWAANHAQFQALAEGNAFLMELVPFSRDLADLGDGGLRLLDALTGRPPVNAAWLAREGALLTRLLSERGMPTLEVKMAAARPVKQLFDVVKKPGKPRKKSHK
jgi:hexosaminidase